VDRLSETRELIERVPVYAENSGVVTQLMVRDGDYLKPGDPILQLQAYDKVWVIASVPESDLPKMDIGKTANLNFESAPDAAKSGKVDYIYPTIDPKTRTAREAKPYCATHAVHMLSSLWVKAALSLVM